MVMTMLISTAAGCISAAVSFCKRIEVIHFLHVTAVKVWKSKVPKCYIKMNAWLMPKILQGYDQKKLYRDQEMMFSTGVVRENLLKTAVFAQKKVIITCGLII